MPSSAQGTPGAVSRAMKQETDVIEIAGRRIGRGERPYLIAEIGINHGGDAALAMRMVREAARAGADAVKLQVFRSELFLARSSDFYDVLHSAELDEAAIRALMACAAGEGVAIFASTFDAPSTRLMSGLGAPAFKVASGDVTNVPLLQEIARQGKPVILSSGGATMGEVEAAVFAMRAVEAKLPVAVLHCVSNYPTKAEDANLACIATIESQLQMPVGFSDHTIGETVAVAAVALGAAIIEKHFTHDRGADGPDHALSSDAQGLKALREAMDLVWLSIGRKAKAPVEAADFIPLIRRSLTALTPLDAGHVITAEDIAVKRPGTGIEPRHLEAVLGMRTSVPVAADETLTWDKITDA